MSMGVQKHRTAERRSKRKEVSQGTLFVCIVAARIVNALSIQTFFQPDEYWQSLEPAHKLVYGYGWLTWEWKEHIRSAAHPLIFAAIYKMVDFLGLSNTRAVVIAPKIFQAIIAATGDFYADKLGKKLLGHNGGKWTLLASCASAFNWFCVTRTFSNSLEMVLTTVGLYYWPWDTKYSLSANNSKDLAIALVVASIACIFRPTNALLWGFLGLKLVLRTRSIKKPLILALGIGGVSLGLSTLIDAWYYEAWVFPISNFVAFNVYESLSQFYGVSPWHYYLTQGLPLLLIGYLPLVLSELVLSYRTTVTQLIAFVVFTYSLLAHKETRFIYPLIPLLHVLFGRAMTRISTLKRRSRVFTAILLVNIPVAFYFSLVHQRGVISVVDYLRTEQDISQVGFLMPCHSTPWQSHIHRNDIESWFLTCEPPIGLTQEEQMVYLDEADQFYDHPIEFTEQKFYNEGAPSHLVIFEALEPTIIGLLQKHNYMEHKRFFNSHFHDDWRRKGDVIMYIKQEATDV